MPSCPCRTGHAQLPMPYWTCLVVHAVLDMPSYPCRTGHAQLPILDVLWLLWAVVWKLGLIDESLLSE